MGIITHNGVRSLKTLTIIEPLLNTSPVTEQQLIRMIRHVGIYNWADGVPLEFSADLCYLHYISGLTRTVDGKYKRGQLTNYWLGRV